MKVVLRTEKIIDTEEYSCVEEKNKTSCDGCPFYAVSAPLVICYDIFRYVYGTSCLDLKAIPKSSAKTITKTSVLVDGKELTGDSVKY